MRPRFQEFVNKELPNWHILLAEGVLDALVAAGEAKSSHELAALEEFIGQMADAIVLFPESPGSYAELGYFAKTDKMAKKSLIISNSKFQGRDSFISLGPDPFNR